MNHTGAIVTFANDNTPIYCGDLVYGVDGNRYFVIENNDDAGYSMIDKYGVMHPLLNIKTKIDI